MPTMPTMLTMHAMPAMPTRSTMPFTSLRVPRHLTPANFDKELFLEFNLGPQVI